MIELNPNQNTTTDQGTLPIDPGPPMNIAPSLPVAQSRAAKASVGLSNLTGRSEGDIYDQILQGRENDFRNEAASAVDFQKSLDKQNFINSVVRLFPDAVTLARDKYTMSQLTGLPPPTDPKSVVEDYLSGEYLKPTYDVTNDFTRHTEMPERLDTDPTAKQTIDTANKYLAYQQYAESRTQLAEDKLKNQSWIGWGLDELKGFSQIYNELKLRGYTGRGIDWTSALGTALDHERQDLWTLDFPAYKQKFDDIMDHLEKDNPQLAVLFGHAVMGQTERELEGNNFTTVVGVPSDLSVVGGLARKAFFKGAEAVDTSVARSYEPTNFKDYILPKMDKAPSEYKNFTEFRKAARAAGYKDADLARYKLGTSIDFHNANYVRNAVKDVIDSTSKINLKGDVTTEDIKGASALGRGDLKEAAVQQISKELYSKVTGKIESVAQKFREIIPSFLKSDADDVGVGGDTEIANRVREQTGNSQEMLEDAVNNIIRVQRTPAAVAVEDVSRLAVDSVYRKYAGPNSTVLRVENDPKKWVWLGASNRYMLPIYQGDQNGEVFKRLSQAKSHIKMNGIEGEAIKQEGLGYVVRSLVPLVETEDTLRDGLLDMPNSWSGPAHVQARSGTKVPYLIDTMTGEASTRTWDVVKAFFNSGFRGALPIRSPTETLSPVEQEQREIATFGPSKLMEMFSDNNRLIHKGKTKELLLTLTSNQTMPVPGKPLEQGYFFKNIGQLKTWYDANHHRLPTPAETQAYFAFKNNYEMERSLRALTMLRNKSRLGFMSYRIMKTLKDFGKSRSLTYSDWFDARPLDDLPRTNDPVFVNTAGKQYVKKANSLTKEEAEGIKLGKYKVLEIWNREDQPLHGYSDQIKADTEPRYVITDSHENRQLDFNQQVPRRGGGHWVFDYRWYLKQADVYYDPITGTYNYRGDITLMPFQLRALGNEIAKHFNNIRLLLKADNENGARSYTHRLGVAGLDFDKDILPMFKPTKGLNGQTVKPRFNLDEEFRLVGPDKHISDLDNKLQEKYGDKFMDFTRKGNIARNASVEFTSKRDAYDLHTIEDKGTYRNPVYQYRPAKLLNPMDSLNRSMARISNSIFMDDYKYMAVEHWIESARQWLDVSKEELRHSPFYWFQRAEFRKDAPENVKAILMGNRKLIQSFVGTPSPLTSVSNVITAQLMDSIYKTGLKASYLPLNKLPFETNPLAWIRGLVFDMKLGLGALPAFFTQITAFSNVMAINPRQAAVAAMAGLLHTWSKLGSDAMLDELDRRATNLRIPGFSSYRPGELKEAIQLSKKTGFFHVGSEHAMVDNMLKDRGVQTTADTIRYWGRTAFRTGAQAVRKAAFFSAHKEFRDKFPTKVMTRADEAWIINRAALLDHNMSRAANSALNSGAFSVPAQFYTYARNLAEMFYGKRLTRAEKLRLFSVNAVLWGIPAGGIGLLGLPVGDWFNKEAIKHGYVSGQNFGSTTAVDGLMAAVTAYINGGGDIQKGTVYDFSKFGVKGWDPIDNFVDEDKSWLDFIGGASWSTLKNTWQRSGNFVQDMGSLIHGDGKFQLKADDVADLFKEATGFSDFWRTKAAINTGVWMSNNNTPLLQGVGWGQALLGGITGLVPTSVSNISAVRAIIQERKEERQDAMNEFSRNFNLALLAKKSGDESEYESFMTKANAWMSATTTSPDERARMISEVLRQKETLVKSLDWDLAHQNVPEEDQQIMQEREQEQEQMQEKKDQ